MEIIRLFWSRSKIGTAFVKFCCDVLGDKMTPPIRPADDEIAASLSAKRLLERFARKLGLQSSLWYSQDLCGFP